MKYTVHVTMINAIQDKECQIGEGAIFKGWSYKAFLKRRYLSRYLND